MSIRTRTTSPIPSPMIVNIPPPLTRISPKRVKMSETFEEKKGEMVQMRRDLWTSFSPDGTAGPLKKNKSSGIITKRQSLSHTNVSMIRSSRAPARNTSIQRLDGFYFILI